MSNFFSSLFGGSDSTLNSNINKFGQQGGFDVGLGQGDTSKASQFYSSILSGDPSQIAKSLGPEIAGIQGQKNQQLNSTAQFGNRSGGNNASNQMAGDQARSSVSSMVSSLLGSSASSLGSLGTNLISQGQSAYQAQDAASQQRMQNWSNSILGKGITGAVQGAESFATGGLGGLAAGAGGSFLQGGAAALS